jgi:hypothetical protein
MGVMMVMVSKWGEAEREILLHLEDEGRGARGGGGIPGESLGARPDLALAGNAADGLDTGKGSAVNSTSRGASSTLLEVGLRDEGIKARSGAGSA